MSENKFLELFRLNVNDFTETKQGLTYLSWASAVGEFKKVYPDMTYEFHKTENGNLCFGDEDFGYYCQTSVTAGGNTHTMILPIMDGANKPQKLKSYKYTTKTGEKVCLGLNMFDTNKTLMRCLVKNFAMFGLGLYIYSGTDLPEVDPEEIERAKIELENKVAELSELCKELEKSGVEKEVIIKQMKTIVTSGKFSDIKDTKAVDRIIKKLNKLKGEK